MRGRLRTDSYYGEYDHQRSKTTFQRFFNVQQETKDKIAGTIESTTFRIVIFFSSLIALFLGPVSIWVLPKTIDVAIGAVTLLICFIFFGDFVGTAIYKDDYIFRIPFFLDVIAIGSLIPDSILLLFQVEIGLDPGIAQGLKVARAAKIAQVAMKLTEVEGSLHRFVLKVASFLRLESTENTQTKIGGALLSVVQRKIIVGVLLVLLVLPALQRTSLQIEQSGQNEALLLQNMELAKTVDVDDYQKVLQVYLENHENQILFLSVLGQTVIEPSEEAISKLRAWEVKVVYADGRDSTDDAWNVFSTSIWSDSSGGVNIDLSKYDSLVTVSWLSDREQSQQRAILDVISMAFVLAILLLMSVLFSKDLSVLVIRPIGKMQSVLDNLSADVDMLRTKGSTDSNDLDVTLNKVSALLQVSMNIATVFDSEKQKRAALDEVISTIHADQALLYWLHIDKSPEVQLICGRTSEGQDTEYNLENDGEGDPMFDVPPWVLMVVRLVERFQRPVLINSPMDLKETAQEFAARSMESQMGGNQRFRARTMTRMKSAQSLADAKLRPRSATGGDKKILQPGTSDDVEAASPTSPDGPPENEQSEELKQAYQSVHDMRPPEGVSPVIKRDRSLPAGRRRAVLTSDMTQMAVAFGDGSANALRMQGMNPSRDGGLKLTPEVRMGLRDKSIICTPLKVGGRFVGVIYLEKRRVFKKDVSKMFGDEGAQREMARRRKMDNAQMGKKLKHKSVGNMGDIHKLNSQFSDMDNPSLSPFRKGRFGSLRRPQSFRLKGRLNFDGPPDEHGQAGSKAKRSTENFTNADIEILSAMGNQVGSVLLLTSTVKQEVEKKYLQAYTELKSTLKTDSELPTPMSGLGSQTGFGIIDDDEVNVDSGSDSGSESESDDEDGDQGKGLRFSPSTYKPKKPAATSPNGERPLPPPLKIKNDDTLKPQESRELLNKLDIEETRPSATKFNKSSSMQSPSSNPMVPEDFVASDGQETANPIEAQPNISSIQPIPPRRTTDTETTQNVIGPGDIELQPLGDNQPMTSDELAAGIGQDIDGDGAPTNTSDQDSTEGEYANAPQYKW